MLGVCYYPEHWPEAIWGDDARRMAELGLQVVRIGEFAWSRLEPGPGRLAFDWLDRAIETLAGAGLGVVLGVPTATPPKWLVDLHPEILPIDPATGQVRRFGSRRHYDFASPAYRRESLRITTELARRYGGDVRVIGWQTDNELTGHGSAFSASPAAAEAFRAWCRTRYGDIATLNSAWGTVFWSAELGGFEELDPPLFTVCEPNPAHLMAWRRFCSDQVSDWHRAQVDAIRAHAGPDQFVTHNMFKYSWMGTDPEPIFAACDFASHDSYPLGVTDMALADRPAEALARVMRTGLPDLTAFDLDRTRGLSARPFWVMEQQPGPVNWAPHNPKPAPGMVRLWSLQAFAHGAACVSFFRWRQAPFGPEQMHAGLNRPDNSPAPGWFEVRRLATELPALGSLALGRGPTRIAMVVDVEAGYVAEIERQGRSYDHERQVADWYSALRSLGLDVDVLPPSADFSGYHLVAAPTLAQVDAALPSLARCQGQILLGPRSGAKTAEFRIPDALPPGPLQALIPIKVTAVETLRPDCPGALEWEGRSWPAVVWRETLELSDGVETLARFDDGGPALVRHGRITYVAAVSSLEFLRSLLRQVALAAGLPVIDLPWDLRLTRRGGLVFAFNYADRPQRAPAPPDAVFVLGGPMVKPRDVSVWRLPETAR